MPVFLIYKTICVAFLSGILSLTSCVIGLSVSLDVDNVVGSFSWRFLWAYSEWQRGGGEGQAMQRDYRADFHSLVHIE